MFVFLSYSIHNTDSYLITLLADILRNKGYKIVHSSDFKAPLSKLTQSNIEKSDLFIGFITSNGEDLQRVNSEWRKATASHLPILLIVEDKVNVSYPSPHKYISFSRKDPSNAIHSINAHLEQTRCTREANTHTLNLLLGGAAIVSLLHLLPIKNPTQQLPPIDIINNPTF